MSKKKIIIAVLSILFIGFVALVLKNYKDKIFSKPETKISDQETSDENTQDGVSAAVNQDEKALAELRKNSELTKIADDDFVLGNRNAKVVMIEYASLSCPHCAYFVRESFEKIKAEYIDTGKVAFVFRNFPLNQPALMGAMIVNCYANDDAENKASRYYSSVKVLFRAQDSWAFDEKFAEKLEAVIKLEGMSSERFKKCTESKSLQDKILNARMEVAKTLQIKSTPTFFVNGEISEGYIDYKTLKDLIEKNL